jgi:hypothetical protein
MMKKLLAVLMVFALLFTVAACGNDASDPNLGKYVGVSCEMLGMTMDMTEVYPGENYLELKSGGSAVVVLDGDRITGKWTLDGDKFNINLENEDCPGTLKDGVVTFDLAGYGIMLTFAKEGSKIPAPTGAPKAETLQPGFYPLYAMDQDGEYTDNDLIVMAGMDKESYLVVYEDGTLDFIMDGEKYICTFDENSIIDDEGGALNYKIVDGLVEVYFENNLTFYYKLGNMDDIPVETHASAAAFPADVVEGFSGDWHGWCVINYGTGEYEDEVDNEFELLARYVFDEDGYCTPWMAIYSKSEDNFQNLVLTYDEEDGFVYLSGELFGMTIVTEYSYMYELFGSISLTISLEDENGSMDISICMRHPGDEWDEYDYPCMPASAVEYYDGMTFEEMVALYGLDPDDLP